MERRQVLKMLATIGGGVVVGMEVFLSGCKNNTRPPINFSKDMIALLDEIGETILPRTKSPGAKDAAIGKFMQTIVTDCYYPPDQKIFFDGLAILENEAKQQYSKSFIQCNIADRTALIKKFDDEAKAYNTKKLAYDADKNTKAMGTLQYNKDLMPNHWFAMVKQLTLWGFFTSKPGATQALRYEAVPGKYEGDVPYKKGDKALYPCY